MKVNMVGGLLDLAESGWFEKGYRILFLHLGGTPSIHAYANQLPPTDLRKSPI